METYSTAPNQRLLDAQKQVKRMKGFYIHATVYAFVNLLIIFGNWYDAPTNWLNTDTFATAFFWGIGLATHAFSVWGRDLLFGKKWEERKIQEILSK